jgi:hypothetical protein
MARKLQFKEGETLIGQGEEETAAYLIQDGWLQVRRQHAGGKIFVATLGPGEIVGELGLAGVASKRTATVIALTDGSLEIVDRGALIRLVNGPGSRLVPLLAALFSRLQDTLIEESEQDDTLVMYAKIKGLEPKAMRALCNQQRMITHLPWTFGAYSGPLSVTDLFRPRSRVDVKLADDSRLIREKHVQIEATEEGGLQLRLIQHGDYCELDGERIGFGKIPITVPLPAGKHTLIFGNPNDPCLFSINALV